MATLYRRTGILATACLIFSLLVSALYARRLLHPILAVRQVVQRVAGGDLSARACIERLDELGSLAESVNSMTEALLRRDRIVQSVRFAAQQFLSTGNWSGVVEEVLARIGQAAGTGSVYVFGGVEGKNSPPPRKPLALWSAPEARAAQPACDAVASRLPSHELDRWLEQLAKGETLTTSMVDPDVGQSCIRSIIWSPIFVEDAWWGILGLESCDQTVRAWTDAEQDSIRAAADMLGAAIARQKTQDALIEAKQNLEQRVNDRTKELREQVQAKERARAELAEAQQQLVEVSRRTGMAEVATGVLHNVGNVLNSVNVSVNLLKERLNHSVSQNMEKVAALLAEHRADLPVFLQSNPRGTLLPEYLAKLAILMREERDQLVAETQNLGRSTEHIKEIVAMQQSYARVAGVVEDLPATVLVEDALRIQSESFARHAIKVQRDFKEVPLVRVDKHKVLQILVNLFRNARDAMKAQSAAKRSSKCRCCGTAPTASKCWSSTTASGSIRPT
ncbi:MAG: HAMP domain-containing protein [Verrucomicrobiota bacterium]